MFSHVQCYMFMHEFRCWEKAKIAVYNNTSYRCPCIAIRVVSQYTYECTVQYVPYVCGPQSVDYKGMSSDPVFERYCDLAIQLQRVELLSLSREEKLAFFINIYNALVIHGALRLGAPTNMWQRYRVRALYIHTNIYAYIYI